MYKDSLHQPRKIFRIAMKFLDADLANYPEASVKHNLFLERGSPQTFIKHQPGALACAEQ